MTTLRGMIATVGGSPEPIVKALEVGQPSHVLFIVSERSWSEVDERILPMLRNRLPQYNPQHERFMLTDPQHLGSCYQEISDAVSKWKHKIRLKPDEIFIDYTGGTKSMSASLTLSAVEDFTIFTYVGGDERTKEGLGTVITGSERVEEFQNPWNTYAVRELERANWLLDNFHVDTAAEILKQAAQKCGDDIKARIEIYARIAESLARADRFGFGRGKLSLAQSISSHLAKLELFNYPLYEKLIPFQSHWQTIRDQTKEEHKTPGHETLLELLANAQRRAHQSKYDDAAARLYRVAELHAQILLKQAFGIELGKGKLEDFPQHLHKDVKRILGNPTDTTYKISLQNAFRLLKLSDDETISSQSHIGKTLKGHLDKRNNSILAHGSRPVSQDDYENFWKAALSTLGVKDSDIPRWPKISLTLN